MATEYPVQIPPPDPAAPVDVPSDLGAARVALVGPALVCFGLAARLADLPVARATPFASLLDLPRSSEPFDVIVFAPDHGISERRLNEIRSAAASRATVVVVHADTAPEDLLAVLHAGVRVLIDSESDTPTWHLALAAARSDACFIVDAARQALLARAFPADFVQPEKVVSGIRRQQILRMFLQGRSRHEMAHQLGISAKTVSGYLTSIRRDSSFRQFFAECIPVRARSTLAPQPEPLATQ